ncbi:hypothetical protein B5181_26375 [Streptomyces sp. 4F]|nr:hypothetical protein B5181_26375 [Streptomyces sp. 4F]
MARLGRGRVFFALACGADRHDDLRGEAGRDRSPVVDGEMRDGRAGQSPTTTEGVRLSYLCVPHVGEVTAVTVAGEAARDSVFPVTDRWREKA